MKMASYCLFGPRSQHWACVKPVVQAHHHIFPDWKLRIYHDQESLGHTLLRRYAKAGLVELVNLGAGPPVGIGTLWRFKPIWDEDDIEALIVRDIDSLPLVRDRLMVEEWLRTDLPAHCISDHPNHLFPVMCGMVGFRPASFRRLLPVGSWTELASKVHDPQDKFSDQVLFEKLWPFFQDLACEHRYNGQFRGTAVRGQFSWVNVPPGWESPMKVPLSWDESIRCAFKGGLFVGSPHSCWDQEWVSRLFEVNGNKEVNGRVLAAELRG